MGDKLTHAPVYFVLAQLRTNQLPALPKKINDINEQLRKAGYPDLQRHEINAVDISGPAENPKITSRTQEQFAALNMENTAGFLLGLDTIIYQTTEYTVSEDFFDAFVVGINIVHEIMGLNYIDRIGLRILDAVSPREDDDLAQYIDESCLGLYGKQEGALQHTFSETVHNAENGRIVSRAMTQNGKVGLPPDLQPARLKIAERFTAIEGLHTILESYAQKLVTA